MKSTATTIACWGRIKPALNVLAALNLVHVDHVRSTPSELGVANAYRIVHIGPYHHMGTVGRGLDPADFTDLTDFTDFSDVLAAPLG